MVRQGNRVTGRMRLWDLGVSLMEVEEKGGGQALVARRASVSRRKGGGEHVARRVLEVALVGVVALRPWGLGGGGPTCSALLI